MPVAKLRTSISISSRTSSRIGALRYSKMRVRIDGRVVVIDIAYNQEVGLERTSDWLADPRLAYSGRPFALISR
jgi:hypothetical protein